MNDIQTWLKTSFEPWKQEVKAYEAEKQARLRQIVDKRDVLQKVIGMLLDRKNDAAVTLWNQAGLKPVLTKLHINEKTEKLQITTRNGKGLEINLDDALKQLSEMFASTTEPVPADDS